MFKCKVTKVFKSKYYQETYIKFEVSNVGNSSVKNHSLVGSFGNNCFTIGQVDNSIKKGDLIRCDGLPYISKPPTFNRTYTTDSNGSRVKSISFNIPEGYRPFQLESGYWVLRKK